MTTPTDDPWAVFVAGVPPTRAELGRRRLASFQLPASVVAGLVLLGAPVGLLWARISPRVSVSFSAQGPSLDRPESSEFFAADGSFGVILLLVGVVTGALSWALTRRRAPGPTVPLSIAVGGLLAAAVAAAVGTRYVVDAKLAALCTAQDACAIYDGTLQLRSRGLLVVWAVAALVVHFSLTAGFDRESEASAVPAAVDHRPDPWVS